MEDAPIKSAKKGFSLSKRYKGSSNQNDDEDAQQDDKDTENDIDNDQKDSMTEFSNFRQIKNIQKEENSPECY